MYPYISQVLAKERVRELRDEAAQGHRARRARRARRAQEASQAAPVLVPDSFEDFLCQTAESVLREPAATGRANGQTVR